MTSAEILYRVADKLMQWSVTSRIGARDVQVDAASGIIAFVGPALKLELNVLKQPIDNRDFSLNKSFGELFGLPVQVEYWPNSYRVRQTKPMWFHSDDGEPLSQFLDELDGALRDGAIALTGEDPGEDTIRAALITEPGYPFTPGVTHELYSARTKKVRRVEPPPWGTKIKDRDDKERWAVDFCKLMPVICPSGGTAIIGEWRNHPELNYVVTHCTPLARGGKLPEDRSARLHGCPGMLFPSLATGIIPSTNFGETCFVVRPDVILSALRPYRKRGSWDVVTYATDTWTEGAGELTREAAIEAFAQLHGHENWMYSDHAYVLGVTVKETGFMDEPVVPITGTSKLLATLKRHFARWTRDITPQKFERLSNAQTAERYGYLESKVNSVLGWGCLPLCLTPRQFAAKVEPQVRAMGFTGELITVDAPDDMVSAYVDADKRHGLAEFKHEIAEESDAMAGSLYDAWRMYHYAWLVRDAIHAYAHSQGRGVFFEVSEG